MQALLRGRLREAVWRDSVSPRCGVQGARRSRARLLSQRQLSSDTGTGVSGGPSVTSRGSARVRGKARGRAPLRGRTWGVAKGKRNALQRYKIPAPERDPVRRRLVHRERYMQQQKQQQRQHRQHIAGEGAAVTEAQHLEAAAQFRSIPTDAAALSTPELASMQQALRSDGALASQVMHRAMARLNTGTHDVYRVSYAGFAHLERHIANLFAVRAHNTRIWRLFFGGLTLSLGVFYWPDIRTFVAGQSAEVARETLQNDTLQDQTQQLATAVVQTVLNDPTVMQQAVDFLRSATAAPETQKALEDLTNALLRSPETMREVALLLKDVCLQLFQDQDTVDQVAILITQALNERQTQDAINELLVDLAKDDRILAAVTNMVLRVMAVPEVQEKVNDVLAMASQRTLEDEDVIEQSREFVVEVVGDDTLQRRSGSALWSTLAYFVRPALGFGVFAGAVAVVRALAVGR